MPMLLSFPRCPANLAGRMRHSLSFVRLSRTNIVDEMARHIAAECVAGRLGRASAWRSRYCSTPVSAVATW
jgi:hypothetical protein